MQGKRSIFEVGELAEEVGHGALGGVLSIHGGDVCELGRTGIGSRFRRAICPAGSSPGRSIESGGSSMSCSHHFSPPASKLTGDIHMGGTVHFLTAKPV
jgi:hypothetical protein